MTIFRRRDEKPSRERAASSEIRRTQRTKTTFDASRASYAQACLYQGMASAMPQYWTRMDWALAPAMSRPTRNAHPEIIPAHKRTFFATTKSSMGQRLFQSERNAMLLVDVLRSCLIEKEFQIHDFVIMPNHVHLLLTIDDDKTIERAMQLIKGRFSFRIRRELGYLGEVWQGGFSEVRVDGAVSFARHREYIAQNPVKAGLSESPEDYPYCFASLAKKKQQGLKPSSSSPDTGMAKAMP